MKNSLKTKNLYLRPFTNQDLDNLYLLHSNPDVAKTTIDGIQTLEQVKKQLDNFIDHQNKFGFSQMAVFEKKSDNFVGRAGFTKRALNKDLAEYAEIRFAFLPQFWNLGYASEVSLELINFAKEKLLLKEISVSCGLNNLKSQRIIEKNNFIYIGDIIPDGFGKEEKIKFYIKKL